MSKKSWLSGGGLRRYTAKDELRRYANDGVDAPSIALVAAMFVIAGLGVSLFAFMATFR